MTEEIMQQPSLNTSYQQPEVSVPLQLRDPTPEGVLPCPGGFAINSAAVQHNGYDVARYIRFWRTGMYAIFI
jgi:hypothetical protein